MAEPEKWKFSIVIPIIVAIITSFLLNVVAELVVGREKDAQLIASLKGQQLQIDNLRQTLRREYEQFRNQYETLNVFHREQYLTLMNEAKETDKHVADHSARIRLLEGRFMMKEYKEMIQPKPTPPPTIIKPKKDN